MPLSPTNEETQRRRDVLEKILEHVRHDRRIFLPPFDPALSRPSDLFALQSVGLEPNEFGGTVGDYRYQFEGEEDLLHLFVTRQDGSAITPKEGQEVAGYLLQGLPSALIWLKPGEYTQHFYFGHDELIDKLVI